MTLSHSSLDVPNPVYEHLNQRNKLNCDSFYLIGDTIISSESSELMMIIHVHTVDVIESMISADKLFNGLLTLIGNNLLDRILM